MANRYQQFLGAKPGIVVELVDDATSPFTVKTEDGFEFSISAEDFRNYYREVGSKTPRRWSHLVTDPQTGFVDSGKMNEVMGIIRSFEETLQDFGKARAFVRDVMTVLEEEPGADAKRLKARLAESGLDTDAIPDEDLERLSDVAEDLRDLLKTESCAVIKLPTGIDEEDHPLAGTPEPKERGAGTAEKSKKKPSSKARRRGTMKNAEMHVEGNILTITVDLSKELGPSKSGKTTIVATSEGNKTVPGREEKIGLNIYRQESKKPAKGRRASFKNVAMAVDENTLTITVDLSQELGPSKSGKTIIVGSTGGNQLVLGREEKIGLNVYKKID